MVQNVNPTFVKTPNWGAVQITTGTGSSTIVTVYAGGVNGSKVNSLIVSANTTAAFDIQWGVSSGGTFFLYDAVAVPASAGSSDLTPPVSLMSASNIPGLAIDSDGNPFIFLPSSAYSIQAKTPATSSTWSAGVTMNIIAPSVGDF
jgi:hypothetical protein